jgi:16S rRNA (guanine527-N7)-methyltransferase
VIAEGRARALETFPELRPVSQELDAFEALLRQWQPKINLVGPNTLDELWMRHFADSAQILRAAPDARKWADLGSGAGFPGMVVALLLKRQSGARVHLIESDQRKAAFLRTVSRETNGPVEVHAGRIENELPPLAGQVDAVCARALAPLDRLLALAREPLAKGATGVFLKGEGWRKELTAAERLGSFRFQTLPSRTHLRARIILSEYDPGGDS